MRLLSNVFSRLYFGKVRHTRYAPKFHEFTYRLYLVYLDLDELDVAFRNRWFWSTRKFNLAWFRSTDHLRSIRQDSFSNLGPDSKSDSNVDLKGLLTQFLSKQGVEGIRHIRLLTQLRYLGFVMNPVSFYYCYDESECLQAIVAQVNNTPWNEEHLYLIRAGKNQNEKPLGIDRLQKAFHVSPFMPMNMHYAMRYTTPGKKLSVQMANFENDQKRLNVVMNLQEEKITTLNLIRCLVAYPFISFKIFGAIYWEAFRLFLKKTPVFKHPKKRKQNAEHESIQPAKSSIQSTNQ
ncbi:MAG: DUF1365 domain-containing protein [Planctomycetota bacterium]